MTKRWDEYDLITTPADGDTALVHDVSETTTGSKMKRITWANMKATLKTYFDTLYTLAGKLVTTTGPTTLTIGAWADGEYLKRDGTTAIGGTPAGGSGGGTMPNALINGEFRISQRLATFTSATVPANSDDTYLLNRWVLLSDGNDIVDVSQSTTAPTGYSNSIKLEVETANKQFGILQIIENKNSIPLIGGVASLSFQARMAAADDNTHSLKAAILSWSSTADAVTSDVVASWGASVTLAANWTSENAAASNTLTTSWQEFKIENVAIDTASAANLAVFFYCDQTNGVVDDAIYITGVKLESGATATTNIQRPISEELALCAYYYYVLGIGNPGALGVMVAEAVAATDARGSVNFPTPMRVAPTQTVSAVSDWQCLNNQASNNFVVSAVNTLNASTQGIYLQFVCASGLTAGDACIVNSANSNARIFFDSEL